MVAGAVQLWRACRRVGARPAYIHFGSTASVFAGAGLGAYAGANAALEWVAGWQRELGEDARVLVWTSWGAGIAQRDASLSLHTCMQTSACVRARAHACVRANMRTHIQAFHSATSR